MNHYCLFCHEEIIPRVSWTYVFSKSVPTYLCEDCQNQLIETEGELCEKCSRPFHTIDPKFRVDDLCYDCIRWEEDKNWQGYLDKNYSLYIYDDFLKELISQYKFRGDYILAKTFSAKIQKILQYVEYDILVPIPLSRERIYERGFNQSEALIREAGFTPIDLLQRTHSEKQSKRSRKERIHLQQVFQLKESIIIKDKRILLVDDIYTTGSTLRHAAKCLLESGAESVCSLTLARG